MDARTEKTRPLGISGAWSDEGIRDASKAAGETMSEEWRLTSAFS
jgi:hypothetical protein